jgi:tRNA G18 (ribose-2'-O)-methylase SpoU
VIQRIDSALDPRVADYRDVRDRDLMRERSLFVVEGRENLRRLLEESRYSPRSLLLSVPAHHAMRSLLARLSPETPVFVASREVLQGLIGFDLHRGCLAVCGREPAAVPAEVLAPPGRPSRVVVLEGLTNPDNVGAVFRSAMAFGADAVLLCPRCCDPLYRKAIRVSMGAALCLPSARLGAWPEGLECVRNAGYRLVGLDPSPGAVPLRSDTCRGLGPRVALLLGCEGVGLSDAARAACEVRLQIEMVPGFDSLNVATAAAIALQHLFDGRTS